VEPRRCPFARHSSDAARRRRAIAFTRQKSGRWRVRGRFACSLPVGPASSRDYVSSPERKQARHWRKMNAVVQAMTAGLDRGINTSPSGAEQSSQRGIDKAPLGCRARTSGATRRCPQPSLFRRQTALARAVREPEGMRFDPPGGRAQPWTDGGFADRGRPIRPPLLRCGLGRRKRPSWPTYERVSRAARGDRRLTIFDRDRRRKV
jgi:hypothetical protein